MAAARDDRNRMETSNTYSFKRDLHYKLYFLFNFNHLKAVAFDVTASLALLLLNIRLRWANIWGRYPKRLSLTRTPLIYLISSSSMGGLTLRCYSNPHHVLSRAVFRLLRTKICQFAWFSVFTLWIGPITFSYTKTIECYIKVPITNFVI